MKIDKPKKYLKFKFVNLLCQKTTVTKSKFNRNILLYHADSRGPCSSSVKASWISTNPRPGGHQYKDVIWVQVPKMHQKYIFVSETKE